MNNTVVIAKVTSKNSVTLSLSEGFRLTRRAKHDIAYATFAQARGIEWKNLTEVSLKWDIEGAAKGGNNYRYTFTPHDTSKDLIQTRPDGSMYLDLNNIGRARP